MAIKTGILWTNHTFNIAWGCTKISAGCQNCYAEEWAHRYGYDVWGAQPRRVFGAAHWKEPLAWNALAQKENLPHRTFTSSMCDIFEDHPTITRERQKLWSLIRQTPHLQWQLLTKRAERIAANLPSDWGNGYPNVWLGVTVENNRHCERVNRYLAPLPAAVRFISHEPALGPLTDLNYEGLDWYIFGGESGPNFRPMDFAWAREAKALCEKNGVAFFYKQTAGKGPALGHTLDGETIQNFPTPRLLKKEACPQMSLGL